jgi:hypothetical protein
MVLLSGVIARPVRLVLSFEFLFALFVFAGTFKANPSFAWLFPVDPTLLFGIASLALGGLIILRRGFFRPSTVPVLLYFLLCAWMIASLAWTKAEEFGPINNHLLRIIVLNGWVLVGACAVIAPSRVRIARLLVIVALLALAMAGDWIIHARSFDQVGFLEDRSYQNSARLMAIGFIVLFGIVLVSPVRSLSWLVSVAAASACFYALLITGARAPLIGLALAALVMLLQGVHLTEQRIRMRRTLLPAAMFVSMVIGFIVFLLLSGTETWTIMRLQRLVDFFTGFAAGGLTEDADRSVAARTSYIAAAFHYWSSSWFTFVFGNGFLSFPELYFGRYVFGTNPHNIPLEILVELGLIGFAIFAVFVYTIIIHVRVANDGHGALRVIVLGLLVSAVFFSLTSGDLLNFFHFLLFGGLLLSSAADRHIGSERPASSTLSGMTRRTSADSPAG